MKWAALGCGIFRRPCRGVPIGGRWYLEEILGLDALVGRAMSTRIGRAVSSMAALAQEPPGVRRCARASI